MEVHVVLHHEYFCACDEIQDPDNSDWMDSFIHFIKKLL